MITCFTHTPALLYFLNGFVVLSLAIYLSRYGTRSSTIIWLRTFFFFSATYNITSSLTRCADTSSFFNLIMIPYAFVNALMVPILFIFTLHFINKEHLLDHTWPRIFLFTLGGAILYLFWSTDLFLIHDFAKTTESFGNRLVGAGPQSSLIGLGLLLGYIAPIIIMSRYHRHIENPVKKKEVRIVMAALGILVIPGTIIEAVLPIIFHTPSFPIAPFTTVITAVMLTYGITRYGLHVFSLNNVTGNVMQVMPGGLVILDHTNTIQYLNAGAAQMLGYTSGQLAGSSAQKLFRTATDYDQFQTDVISQLGPDKQVDGHEAQFITKAKQPLPISLNAVSVYSGRDLVNRIISFTNIALLKQAEADLELEKASVERKVVERTQELGEAQAQLTASIRSLPFGFAVINPRGQIMFSNELLSNLMNHPLPSDPAASKLALEEVNRNFAPTIDLLDCVHQAQTKAKSLERNVTLGPRFFRFFFMPITGSTKAKTALGTVLLMEDVTEAKNIERSRDEFFSIASHELRTPLTAIRGNADMLLDYYQKQLKDPDMHSMVDDIHAASLRLIAIVNDFLDMSRLEMGKFVFKNEPFNITELIREILREYSVTGSSHKLKLELAPFTGPDPWVRADADRARQVIVNLISNGIKVTTQGSVTVHLVVQNRNLHIKVTDTGMGIPVDSQHLLFHKFQQASNNILTRDNTQSTGLGLYISKLLVTGMHGRIFLERSEVGHGTTFVLELPLAHAVKPS